MSTYVQDAVRTESDSFHAVNNTALQLALIEFYEAGKRLDALKKAIFYGKNLPKHQFGSTSITEDLPRRTQRLLHAIIGVATEAGELVEILYDHVFHDHAVDAVHLKEELGDLNWYEAIACDELGLTLEEVLERNIAKLKARFPDRFTEEAAINRDVKLERKVIERDGVTAIVMRPVLDAKGVSLDHPTGKVSSM